MRTPNDRLFSENVPGIDLCLGGHDHLYLTELCERTGVVIIKSGTDFEEFSDIAVEFGVSKEKARIALENHENNGDVTLIYSKQK